MGPRRRRARRHGRETPTARPPRRRRRAASDGGRSRPGSPRTKSLALLPRIAGTKREASTGRSRPSMPSTAGRSVVLRNANAPGSQRARSAAAGAGRGSGFVVIARSGLKHAGSRRATRCDARLPYGVIAAERAGERRSSDSGEWRGAPQRPTLAKWVLRRAAATGARVHENPLVVAAFRLACDWRKARGGDRRSAGSASRDPGRARWARSIAGVHGRRARRRR